MGNIKDGTLEQLADKGNGHYAYIDSPREAYKVLVEEMGSTLVTVAKDVKIQVEFNPAKVGCIPADRLREPDHGPPGLQRRHQGRRRDRRGPPRDGALRARPAGRRVPGIDPLKYTKAAATGAASDESFTVKLRYKRPDGDKSRLFETGVVDAGRAFVERVGRPEVRRGRRRLRHAAPRLAAQGEPDVRGRPRDRPAGLDPRPRRLSPRIPGAACSGPRSWPAVERRAIAPAAWSVGETRRKALVRGGLHPRAEKCPFIAKTTLRKSRVVRL